MSSFINEEVISDFIQEALTYLDDAREPLSPDGCSADGINAVFRCLHTLKGTSSFLQLEKFTNYVHGFEDFVRDKQEVGAGLTDIEADKVRQGLDLLEESIVLGATPESLAAGKYQKFLESLKELSNVNATLAGLEELVFDLKATLEDSGQDLPADALRPAFEILEGLLVKLKTKQQGLVLPVDYHTIEKIMLKGKDVTKAVIDQLEAFEMIAQFGKSGLSKVDLVQVVGAEDMFAELLTNGKDLLGWEVISDICKTTPNVINEAFRRFWNEGISREAQITLQDDAGAADLPGTEAVGTEQQESEAGPGAKKHEVEEFLRVKASALQELAMDASTMVANRNSLENLIQEISGFLPGHNLRYLKDTYTDLDQAVNRLDLHVGKMNNKQLKDIFNRMPSIVEKLAEELSKEIELDISGEQIEIPRTLLKTLHDPLVHIVRNSCDHGIEEPEIRVAAGKVPQGRLAINALRDDEKLTMTISDDGKGLDPEIIRQKALSKGLIKPDDVLSEQETKELIIAAGFSTSAKVSKVSGRGVGMDVVRNAIESNGGRFSLSSETGQGTTLELVLPLNTGNQTRDLLPVEVAGLLFGVEYRFLREILRFDQLNAHAFKENGFVNYRDSLVPLIDMTTLLTGGQDREPQTIEKILVVEDEQERNICFGIHKVNRKVKAVVSAFEHDFLADNQLFSGAAVVGAGKPILVFNFRDIGVFL